MSAVLATASAQPMERSWGRQLPSLHLALDLALQLSASWSFYNAGITMHICHNKSRKLAYAQTEAVYAVYPYTSQWMQPDFLVCNMPADWRLGQAFHLAQCIQASFSEMTADM